MRLPTVNGNISEIDENATFEMFDYAISKSLVHDKYNNR